MNPQQLISQSPSSLESRFTRRFLQALIKINGQKPISSTPREMFQRYRRVKTAADKSMVHAVGSKRAWSRATLWKIRNQARLQALARRIRSSRGRCAKKKKSRGEDQVGSGQAEELRRLVPGGEAMDMYSLLGETAHYIRCLNTQIQVMRSIVDLYST